MRTANAGGRILQASRHCQLPGRKPQCCLHLLQQLLQTERFRSERDVPLNCPRPPPMRSPLARQATLASYIVSICCLAQPFGTVRAEGFIYDASPRLEKSLAPSTEKIQISQLTDNSEFPKLPNGMPDLLKGLGDLRKKLAENAAASDSNGPMPAPTVLNMSRSAETPFTYYEKESGKNGLDVTKTCRAAANQSPTNNSIVDYRCSLVAFEVCMHRQMGVISQSQDSKKQCAIIQDLGGPAACRQPCLDAAALPKGGNEVVTTPEGTYSGLTKFAASCYSNLLKKEGGKLSACGRNEALQCLMNGSSSTDVNEAIRQERKNACGEYHIKHPNGACTPCAKGILRVDYDPKKIDLDPQYCTPNLAKAGHCHMN